MRQVLPLGLALVVLAWFAGGPLRADDQTQTHEGKVVSVTGNKLIMTMKGSDKEHSHTIAPDAKITLDGKLATMDDLKPGMRIKVTTLKGDIATATKIQAFSERRGRR